MDIEATNAALGDSASGRRWWGLGWVVAAIVALAWLGVVVRYCRAPIALSPDSLNNYAHVWWIGDGFSNLSWRFSMPVLGHGTAITYPYGFFNWTTAAVLFPMWGDWVTTVWTAVGAIGCLAATWCAFPELRRSWWAVAVMVNPAVMQALLFGQQSFAWASMILLFGIAAWRRERYWLAALLVGMAQLNHAAVVVPLVGLLVVIRSVWEQDRSRLWRFYVASVVLAFPGIVLVFTSAAYGDSTWRDRIVNFVSTLAPRSLIVVVPMLLCALAQRSASDRLSSRGARMAAAAFGAVVALNIGVSIPVHAELAFLTLEREPRSSSMDSFVRSPEFDRGATYRVLRGGDAKLGMYILLRAGGHLDSEFFPESAAIKSFDSVTSYASMLCSREVDYVLAFHSYDVTRRTNEHDMLRELVRRRSARVIATLDGYEGYIAYAFDDRCTGGNSP